jgi:hypothetical protein
LSSANVMKKKFQSLFLETYLPAKPNDGPGLYREWLCEAVTLNHPGKVLEYSLHALCITRAGRNGNDQALVVQGNAAYGFALRELQKALLSPRLATKDETLAACYLLSIYEVGLIPSCASKHSCCYSYSNQRPSRSLDMRTIYWELNALCNFEVPGNTNRQWEKPSLRTYAIHL